MNKADSIGEKRELARPTSAVGELVRMRTVSAGKDMRTAQGLALVLIAVTAIGSDEASGDKVRDSQY